MNLLRTIIERLNQRIEVANIFDKQFNLCELNANGNDKAWVHYIGNGQAEVVTNFDAKNGTLFWAKRSKVTVNKTDAFKVSGCKQLYITTFPLTAYAIVRKSHLPCDSEDAQDWLASRIYKLASGTDPLFKQSIGVINYEVVPTGYINEIKTLTANYEWACVSVDVDVQVITSSEDGCYDTCATGDIPLPDLQPCTPCLTEVAVDGVTIIGNGTAADPLSAIGAGGGAIVVEDEGIEVTPVATTLNFTGEGVTASLTSPGVVEVNIAGGGGGGTVTDVTGTAPIFSSGGVTPDISISQADATTDGYLSSADWTTFDGKFDVPTGTSADYLDGTGTPTLFPTIPSTPSLQDVTDVGNSTTNDIDFIANAGLSFDNGTFFRKGTTDAGNGGAKGTAQICSLSYELKWEAGRLYYMEQDGFTIRDVTHNFSVVPQVTDDSSKGFVVGSRWSLDDGTVYLCSDDTIGAAVWAVVATSTPSLQAVTDIGNITTNDLIVQGANDFVGQVSSQTISAYNSVTGAYAEMFVNTSGQLTLSDGTSAGILSVNNLSNANVQLEFPNKVTGNYTIATTADIPSTIVSDVTATAPIASSGGATPDISISQADATTDGYLSSTDWNTFNNKGSGTVTSVDLTMPPAFSVTGNPVTSSGTLAVAAAGLSSQYIRGDGQLANFPTSSGGGASVSYYLNGSVAQGTLGGVAFKQMSSTPVIGAGTDFSINADGYIQSFITDASVPNQLAIPAGNWNFEMYFSANSSGGTPRFYIELYKLSGGTLTLLASNSATPEGITNGTAIDLYTTAVAVPSTVLLAADRLAIRVYVIHSSKTITLHTEDNHLCQVITTFSTGLTALNGLTAQVQSLAVGTSGTDFAISSASSTHTFNLPTASATNRGALSSADWTTFNGKVTSVSGTAPIASSGGATPAISIADAAADGTTKGAAAFTAADFNAASGVISIDYTNGQAASASAKGFLTSADWTTFNGKQAALTPAALTKVDDTNVTLTLGGTPSTALLQSTSLTLGWTGTLADARIASAATWNAKQAALVSGTNIKTINSASILGSGNIATPFELVVAASDEGTALTAGTAKITFRMPRAVTLTAVRASLTTAQASGSIFTVDINEEGTSILSTKLTIDNTEKTSATAATPPVISDTSLADDAEITIDIDQIGNGTAKGLKVMLIGTYS